MSTTLPASWTAFNLPEGFDPSYAGGPASVPVPFFIVGSSDGQVLVVDVKGTPTVKPRVVSYDREAVNGIAVQGAWLAASTRASITLRSLIPNERKAISVQTAPCGAHGLATISDGCFVAAGGKTGVIMLNPADRDGSLGVLAPPDTGPYVYKLCTLPRASGRDLLLCACLGAGLGAMELRWGEPNYSMRMATFSTGDIVDLCPVGKDGAVAILTRDGTLVLFDDPLHGTKPRNVKFKTIAGTAYRVVCCGDDLVVLTSEAVYVLSGLAKKFLRGLDSNTFHTDILVIDADAADINVAHDRWLLLVGDGVMAVDVRELHGPGAGRIVLSETPAELNSGFDSRTIRQNAQSLAFA